MAWVLIFIAGLLEIGWAIGMKLSEGFTKFWPSVLTVVCMITSFVLLTLGMRSLPVGTAYAVWTGIGAAGTAIVGILVLHEPRDPARLICIGLIVAGVFGLKLTHA